MITHHGLADSSFSFHASDAPDTSDTLLPPAQARRIRRRSNNPPLPSILLPNVQSLDNKIDELRRRLNYQQDIKNCNILCFTESWLNDDINIQLAGYTMYRQDRTAASGKTRCGGLCVIVNSSWCTISKEVSSYCFVAVYIPPPIRGWQ